MEIYRAKLNQHILAARQSWETVAATMGLFQAQQEQSNAIQGEPQSFELQFGDKQGQLGNKEPQRNPLDQKAMLNEMGLILERRGKDSPFIEQCGDYHMSSGTPPLVRRGYPLTQGCWAISSIRDIGASLTRERGNFLVHSLVVPQSAVLDQRCNLPWIGLQLSQQISDPLIRKRPSDIFDLHGTGPSILDEALVELDSYGQFRMLAFMAEEMGKAELITLIQRLLAQAGTGAPIDLPMSAPNPDRVAAAARRHLSAPGTSESDEAISKKEVRIPGDRVRAMRLAGAFSILPDAFKLELPYTINQPKPLAPTRRGQYLDYAIRVPREAIPTSGLPALQAAAPVAEPTSWPWLEYCVRLATANPEERDVWDAELCRMLNWFSRLLPKGFPPTRKAIDAGFEFWAQYAGLKPEQRPVVPPLSVLEGVKVDLDVLVELVPPLPRIVTC